MKGVPFRFGKNLASSGFRTRNAANPWSEVGSANRSGSVLGFMCGHCIYRLYGNEALPGVLGNRGTRAIFSGEQRPKNKGNRGTQAIFGNREHSKSRFCFWATRPFYLSNYLAYYTS